MHTEGAPAYNPDAPPPGYSTQEGPPAYAQTATAIAAAPPAPAAPLSAGNTRELEALPAYDGSVWSSNPQHFATDPNLMPSAPQIEGTASAGDGLLSGCLRSMQTSWTLMAANVAFPILLIVGLILEVSSSIPGLWFLILGLIAYALYLYRAKHSGDARYLAQQKTVTECRTTLKGYRRAHPVFWYHS